MEDVKKMYERMDWIERRSRNLTAAWLVCLLAVAAVAFVMVSLRMAQPTGIEKAKVELENYRAALGICGEDNVSQVGTDPYGRQTFSCWSYEEAK